MLKIENIKAICSTDTYDNGRQLCKPGLVRKVQVTELDADTVKAKGLVQGNFGYFHGVKLTLNSEQRNIVENYDCNCYEFTRIKEPCRHCIALALALAEDGETDLGCRLKPGKKKKEAPVPALPVRDVKKSEKVERPEPAGEDPVPPEPEEPEEAVTPTPAEPKPLPWEEPVPEEPTADREPEKKPEYEGDLREMEILFGYEREEMPLSGEAEENEEKLPIPLYWYPNDTTQVFHTNTGIIGTMGTGKTQFTKSLITQLYRQQRNNYDGSPLGILIFDYKGDYNSSKMDFVQATNAKVLRLHQLPFNPMAIFETKMPKPLLPVHTANTFKDTIAKAFRLGPKQQTALYKCIMQAYEAVGIDPTRPETWKRRAPTFDMVYEIYDKNDDIPKNDSLAAAMQKIQAFQLFEPKPYNTASLFDILKGVVVIDLSGYDPDLQSLTVAIVLDQFYSQMHAAGSSATDGTLRQLTKMILVDEADNFMREGYPALKKIMKEGREFGVGTILSTQFLDHFTSGDDDYSKYILTWVVHNVADLKKADVEYIFKTRLASCDTSQIYQRIKGFDRFQSVVKIGNDNVYYIQDKPFFELLKEEDGQ